MKKEKKKEDPNEDKWINSCPDGSKHNYFMKFTQRHGGKYSQIYQCERCGRIIAT